MEKKQVCVCVCRGKGTKKLSESQQCTVFIKQSWEIKCNNIAPTVQRQHVYTDLQMHLPFTTKQYLIKFKLEYEQQIYLFIHKHNIQMNTTLSGLSFNR